MKNNKKLLPLLLTFSVITACNSPVAFQDIKPEQAKPDVEKQMLNKVTVSPSQKVFVASYGNNKGGTISLKINSAAKSFQTKSTDGVLAKTFADIQSVGVGLCTDPAMPLSTLVNSSMFYMSRSGSFFNVNFENVPAGGPYYAVIEVFDTPLDGSGYPTGPSIVKPDNGGSPYSSPDTGANIAVSVNNVTVNSDLTLSPSGLYLDAYVNLLDGIGTNIETNVGITDGTDPSSYNAF